VDPVRNPFVPGAGTPPPELSGRSKLLQEVDVTLRRRLAGRPHKGLILAGLRGVGKTVLLNRIEEMAIGIGFLTAAIEVPEQRTLPELLVPALRSALFQLDRMQGLSEAVKRSLRILRSFVGTVKVSFADTLSLGIDPEPGVADSGDLDSDLTQLLSAVGEAARSRDRPLALIFDELQYLKEDEFAALIVALHRTTQRNLPIVLVGAGLPSVRAIAGRAKSYAERLFDYPTVGALAPKDVYEAVQVPARREGAEFTQQATDAIYELTQGYPYFVQEWAYQAWNAASGNYITGADVEFATSVAIANLDESFFRVRFDRLTPAEKKLLRAMAELGSGPYRSGDVAEAYGARVSTVAPLRAKLIQKGMIYSPSHGDIAFTVPLFDKFMRRVVP
jgi:hypothetical protein